MIHRDTGHSVDATERGERLESWKEIAAYLRRGVTTVQRWEQQEGLPVHRLPHAKKGSVFAIKSELDDWWRARARLGPMHQDAVVEAPQRDDVLPPEPRRLVRLDRRTGVVLATLVALAITGLVMTRVLGQTSVLGLVGVLTGAARPAGPMPEDAVLMLVVRDDALAHRLYRVPIHAAAWEARRPLVVDARRAPDGRLTGDSPADRSSMASPRPDGTGWVVNRDAPDSGEVDLFDVPLAGGVRRLTHAPGFDRDPSHGPDGSRIAFATQRFDSLGRFDLAVLNRRTGAVNPLVHGVTSDEWPVWSPDGSRIAFIRRRSASYLHDLCVVTQDGAVTRCWSGSESPGRSPELLGWYDVRHLVAGVKATGSLMTLALLDVTSGAVTTIASGLRLPRLAPNGRWVVCQCAVPGYPDGTWFVIPLDRPRDFRPVRFDGLSGQAAALIWAPDSPRPPYLHALAIVAGPGEPIAGVPHQLHALGRDTAGAPIELGALTWRSSDSTIATIDSSGLLLPRRSGAVQISASSGGWRAATAVVSVRAPATRVVLDEQWQAGFTTAWRVFGTPAPLLEREVRGAASIAISGAGLYPTGIYFRQALSPRDGITVDAELSVRATQSDVQSLWVALTSTPDSSMLAAWDHATGFPQPHGQPIAQCTAGVPRGRLAPEWGDSLFLAAGTTATVPVDAGLRHGARQRFRLQLFPDGWCGIAMDDRPVFASPSGLTSTAVAPLRLFVYGTSDGAPVRVHRVQVWTGVRDDIDWATVRQSINAPSRRG